MFWRGGIRSAPRANKSACGCVGSEGGGTYGYPGRDKVAFIEQQHNLLMRLFLL